MVQGYGSIKMTGSHPNKSPDGLGDFLLEQDYIRDKAWLWDRIGALMMDIFGQGTPAGILLSGGAVTAASGTTVNVAAGIGYAPYTIDLGTGVGVPPNTAVEDIAPVRVAWGAQSGIGTINAAGTWYVKVVYAEQDWLSRVRAKAGGSWYFGKKPYYSFVINQSAPSVYEVLLATVVSTGAAITSITPAQVNALPQQYDLVIDSNAKFDLWCAAAAGQYPRVLIKAGTWTATALGAATAGVLVDLDKAGTKYVFAEKGSLLTAALGTVSTCYGLYHAAVTTDLSAESFHGVNLNITNSGGVMTGAFYNLTNLYGCNYGTVSGSSGTGFTGCVNLFNCTSKATIGDIIGFSGCTNLTQCSGIVIGSVTLPINSRGFVNCNNLVSCIGVGSCNSNSNTVAYGFSGCIGLVLCAGQGLFPGSGVGVGYGFFGCKKMSQNKPYAASKNATYNTSYADAGVANACADTAAGGYNS